MSEPTPTRWPALLGLLFIARRLGAWLCRLLSRQTWGDPALLPLTLLTPFVFTLARLRKIGYETAGTKPDPSSLVERFLHESAPGHNALAIISLFFLWPMLLLFGTIDLVRGAP